MAHWPLGVKFSQASGSIFALRSACCFVSVSAPCSASSKAIAFCLLAHAVLFLPKTFQILAIFRRAVIGAQLREWRQRERLAAVARSAPIA
jgi:hypothetical protein